MNVPPPIPFQTPENKNHHEDLANVDHFDAIPYWSAEKCIRFLESSVTKLKEKIQLPGNNNQQMKPAVIRQAIAERLEDLIHAHMSETMTLKQQVNRFEQLNRIQTDLINDQAFAIQQLVSRVPELAAYPPQATQPLRTTSSWEEQCQNTGSKLQHIQILSGHLLVLGKDTTAPSMPSTPSTPSSQSSCIGLSATSYRIDPNLKFKVPERFKNAALRKNRQESKER